MLALGSRAAIDQSLTRLAREGTILRVARGAYVRPKESRFVGKVIPEPQETVKAMAQARGETLLVHGAEAVLRFGLTTQVPVRSLFYTSGPSRKLRVGKQEVILRHASLRLLALGSGAAAMAFSALWYMGKRQVTMATLARIQEKLSPAEFCELRKSAQLPGWLSDLFHDFEKAGPNRSRSKM
jgi:hypothetical protein